MVYDFSRLSITEFIDFAMDLENISMKKYNEFSKRTSDENIKNILMNLSEVCAKHSRLLLEIKKETKDEHEKQILILLPPPDFDKLFDIDKNITSWELLYEASKLHIMAEESMLINYNRLNQTILNPDVSSKITELLNDEAQHLQIMASIVKDFERQRT